MDRCQQQALRGNFFASRAKYPNEINDSFRFQAREVETRGAIAENRMGARHPGWHISFACEIAHEAPAGHCKHAGPVHAGKAKAEGEARNAERSSCAARIARVRADWNHRTNASDA